jgi:hypothetical protein
MMDMPDFESWWERHGQYCRAGGGEYEISFARAAWQAATEQAAKAAEDFLTRGRSPLGRSVAAAIRAGSASTNPPKPAA